ncbi:MAG: SAM-dependent methyltransferase [Halobellus sp.]|uniref:SAM-dependent methyltransferase n=1 Tax=Halobellus sp. TaxID=1979212 RepID=UPI0035D40D2A
MNHARPRYLESKRSIDQRAFSRPVRDRFFDELPSEPRIFEAGCGTGVTVPRLLSWGVEAGRYRGVDTDPRIIAFARAVRPQELRREGHATGNVPPEDGVSPTDAAPDEDGRPDFTAADLSVRFATGDALAALESSSTTGYDAVVAQAFADLVAPSRLASAVESSLRPGGLAYFPITFDGGTLFQPDHPADDAVEKAYHTAIDDRPGHDPRAGRHLLDLLGRRDGDLLAAGGSDWIVRPRNGGYPADERYFLSRILGFIAEAVPPTSVDVPDFDDWLATRREQLAAGTLTYVAHQYDLLYRSATE